MQEVYECCSVEVNMDTIMWANMDTIMQFYKSNMKNLDDGNLL